MIGIDYTDGGNESLLANCSGMGPNGTLPDYCDYGRHDYSEAAAMERLLGLVVPALFGLIVVVGLAGNALVVLVVLCNPQMRSTTNLLIINLAAADLLFIVFCVPFTAWDYALPYWPFGDTWCRAVQYLVIVCAYASIYTLVLMSLDRFLAVCHPVTSMSVRTERNALLAIGATWLLILGACVPALGAHGELRYSFAYSEYSVCVFLAARGYDLAAFQICFFLSSFVVPLALIFALYLLMLRRLWRSGAAGRGSAEQRRSKRRVTRMVVAVVVAFACCWCPIQAVLVAKSVGAFELTPANIALQIAAHVLAYANSCLNPLLYAFLSDNFRKAFRKVVACGRGERRPSGRPRPTNTATKTTKVSNQDVL